MNLQCTPDPGQSLPPVAQAVEPKKVDKIYSVPRRFDLATVLIVSIGYSMLFGLFSNVGAHWLVYVLFVGLTVVVAVAQAVVQKPSLVRSASIIAGTIYCMAWATIALVDFAGFGIRGGTVAILCGCFPVAMLFAYIAGVVDGGVFLIADVLRRKWGRTNEEPVSELEEELSKMLVPVSVEEAHQVDGL